MALLLRDLPRWFVYKQAERSLNNVQQRGILHKTRTRTIFIGQPLQERWRASMPLKDINTFPSTAMTTSPASAALSPFQNNDPTAEPHRTAPSANANANNGAAVSIYLHSYPRRRRHQLDKTRCPEAKPYPPHTYSCRLAPAPCAPARRSQTTRYTGGTLQHLNPSCTYSIIPPACSRLSG